MHVAEYVTIMRQIYKLLGFQLYMADFGGSPD